MISLIITLISIALFAIFMVIGVNSVSTDRIYQGNQESELRMALPALKVALNNYKRVYGDYPDASGDWESEVFPAFGMMPIVSMSGATTFFADNGSVTTCIEVSNDEMARTIASSISESPAFSAGHSCGTTESINEEDSIFIQAI